jgi:RimJ/RimL family protein N-acetyltransferase
METTSINPTDIAVIVILLLSALLAFARGLVREVLSVGAWVGAAFAQLALERVVALAFPANTASTRVMEKIGMRFQREVDKYGETLVEYAIERAH